MKLSWRSLRPCWPRMHCSPRHMSVEHRNASQDGSVRTMFLQISSSKNIDLSRLQPFPLAPVSITLWMICYHRMQILSFKTLCRRISQRFCLTEGELYICFHILPNTLVGERSITPFKECWMEQCFFFSQRADFSPLGTTGISEGNGEK